MLETSLLLKGVGFKPSLNTFWFRCLFWVCSKFKPQKYLNSVYFTHYGAAANLIWGDLIYACCPLTHIFYLLTHFKFSWQKSEMIFVNKIHSFVIFSNQVFTSYISSYFTQCCLECASSHEEWNGRFWIVSRCTNAHEILRNLHLPLSYYKTLKIHQMQFGIFWSVFALD